MISYTFENEFSQCILKYILFEPRIESRLSKIPSSRRQNEIDRIFPSASRFDVNVSTNTTLSSLSLSIRLRHYSASSEVERIIIIIIVVFVFVAIVVIHRVRLPELDFMSRRWGSEAREAFQWDNRGHPAPRSAPARRTAWAIMRVPSRLPRQGNRVHRTEAQSHLVSHIS